jgi:hypothetical protein
VLAALQGAPQSLSGSLEASTVQVLVGRASGLLGATARGPATSTHTQPHVLGVFVCVGAASALTAGLLLFAV